MEVAQGLDERLGRLAEEDLGGRAVGGYGDQIQVGLRPVLDLGERRGYRALQWIAVASLVAFWALGWGLPLNMAIRLCVLLGIFLLLPIMANWKSFERTRRARWIGAIVGLEGAKAVQATLAIALWVFALLIGMDTIHIRALEAPEQAPPEATAKPDPVKPTAPE